MRKRTRMKKNLRRSRLDHSSHYSDVWAFSLRKGYLIYAFESVSPDTRNMRIAGKPQRSICPEQGFAARALQPFPSGNSKQQNSLRRVLRRLTQLNFLSEETLSKKWPRPVSLRQVRSCDQMMRFRLERQFAKDSTPPPIAR